MHEIRKQQTGRGATRRFRRVGRSRSLDGHHQSTTGHLLPLMQAPFPLQGRGVGECWDPGKPKSRVTTLWISVSFLELKRRALMWRHEFSKVDMVLVSVPKG